MTLRRIIATHRADRTGAASARRWPGHAAIRRWHFYAGLFSLPFVVWLSLTGAIYLFRPQVEAWLDRPYAAVAAAGAPRARAASQADAAVRAVPGSVLHRYQLPETATQAVQVIVGRGEREWRVYVHPRDLSILRVADEDRRPMAIVSRLHGELLAGDIGSYVVELAASWTIVMILSGLLLWWPRGQGAAGVVYPRLRGPARRRWRDLHAVTGFWVSAMALFLLVSGLPWAKSWGTCLQAVRTAVEPRPVVPDWTVGHAGDLRARAAADAGTRAMLGDHAEHLAMTMAHPATSSAPLDAIAGTLRPMGLAAPVLISPPTGADAPWTAKSDAADRPRRVDLTLDAQGRILTRRDFADRALADRLVGWGVAVHEGQAFGWVNQLVNLLTAAGLVLLSVSASVLWWRRRPDGVLGAPSAPPRRGIAIGFVVLLVGVGVLLPLFGASLLLVLAVERLLLRRIPPAARWLGLARPARADRFT